MSARLLALALVLVATVTGCGYHRALAPPPGARSVGVALFVNDSPERDLERELSVHLTEALRDLVEAPIESPAEADVLVAGRIVDYRRRGGIRDKDNRLLESGVGVVVEAWLVDRRSARPLGAHAAASTQVGYIVDASAGERIARARALRHLADRLILDLFQPEGGPVLPGESR